MSQNLLFSIRKLLFACTACTEREREREREREIGPAVQASLLLLSLHLSVVDVKHRSEQFGWSRGSMNSCHVFMQNNMDEGLC